MVRVRKVLFLRGLMRGKGHWTPLQQELVKSDLNFEAFFVELAGCGLRSSEVSPIDPILAIEDLRRETQKMNLAPPFEICAISLGGMIALKWAELYPAEIKKLYLINSSLKQLSPFFHRISLSALGKILLSVFKSARDREEEILKLTCQRSDKIKDYLDLYSDLSSKNPLQRQNLIRQLVLATCFEIKQATTCPITVISSDRDQLVNPKCSRNLAQFLKTDLIKHPTAGHDLPFDDPQWLLNALNE